MSEVKYNMYSPIDSAGRDTLALIHEVIPYAKLSCATFSHKFMQHP